MKPKCQRCGSDADFTVSNAKLGIPPTDYCDECFAIDHPEEVEIKDMGRRLAEEWLAKKREN